MKFQTFAMVLAVCAIVSACQKYNEPVATLSTSFGEATRHNMAMQIINPEGSSKSGVTGLNGLRAAKAINDYQKAAEKDIEILDKDN